MNGWKLFGRIVSAAWLSLIVWVLLRGGPAPSVNIASPIMMLTFAALLGLRA